MKFVVAVTVARYLGTPETREFFLLTHYSIMSPSISQKTSESSSPKHFASLHIVPGEPRSSEDQDESLSILYCKGHPSNILSFICPIEGTCNFKLVSELKF